MPLPVTRRSLLGGALLLGVTPAWAQSLREVTIAVSSMSFGAAAPRVAKELGLFKTQGLDPRLTVMDSGNAAIAALLSGSVPFSLSGPGEVIAARARGQKLVLLANGYAGLAGTLVLAKATADKLGVAASAPPADRLKALSGLLLASPSATSVYTVGYKIAAAKAGARDVRFTYIAQPAMAAALESEAIQGFIAGAPFWAPPVLKGTGVAWVSAPKGELPPEAVPSSSICLVAAQDFAEANRDLVGHMRAAFADLGKAIKERPADVKAAVARLFPDLDAPTLDLLFSAESSAWGAGPLTTADVAHDITFTKDGGVQVPGLDTLDPASVLLQ